MYIKTTTAIAESVLIKKIEEASKLKQKRLEDIEFEKEDCKRFKSLPWYSSEKFWYVWKRDEESYWRISMLKREIVDIDNIIHRLTHKIDKLHDSVDGFVYVDVEE